MGRNWQFAKQKGKEYRLSAEREAALKGQAAPSRPPLFSRDATIQSYFEKAWYRVSLNDIRRHIETVTPPRGVDAIAKLRSLRHEHF